jgi:hypothetical protein
MKGSRGVVVKVERVASGVDVTVDLGEDTVTAEHYTPPGVDALPQVGDEVVVEEAEGQGDRTVSKYQPPAAVEGVAAEGEHRVYARDASGAVVCEIHLKGSMEISLGNAAGGIQIRPDGTVVINGVEISPLGAIVAPDEITAMAVTPAAPLPSAVTLSQHIHPTGVGPSGPPQPGT